MIELSVEDLHLDYGDNPVLKGVSMQLRQGEVVSLLGPSGSGKTTLLRAVAGLEGPKRGRITIGDRVVYDGAARREIPAEERNLGLVFQSYALWPHKTVFDNVAYPLCCARRRRPRCANACRPCWTSSAWASSASAIPTSCPAASSSAWPSAARWCTARP